VMLNTLTIPRGFLIKKIELPDKTNVWLSAVSTIRFPDNFSGNERRVEVEGEAYFEVAKDASKPFIVSITTKKGKEQRSEVRVLGTHFSISAYDNEEGITTTLLEGSVQVSGNNDVKKIKPGQQAVIKTNKPIKIIDQIDTSAYAAHREGIFRFRKEPVTMIMNQVERMYHVKVVPSGTLPDEFSTTLDQRNSLQYQIDVFNASDELECSLSSDKSTITVKPKAK
jgi:transmembrane sensor